MVRQKEFKVPDLGPGSVNVFELEDALFHHNSSILLPTKPIGPGSKDGTGPSSEILKVTGLSVIADIYNFLEQNPNKMLIIAGNTDTTGEIDYNFELSMLRASNVLSLLEGNKKDWVKSTKKYKVEDYQQILKFFSTEWGWNCNPGIINGKLTPETKKAIKQFQITYNKAFYPDSNDDDNDDGKLDVDGIVGEKTWGAIYDCYNQEIVFKLNTTPEDIVNHRNKIKFVSNKHKILACGESRPIEAAHKDKYRSQTNRRIEIFLIDSSDQITIKCPDPMGPYKNELCNLKDCPFVYWEKKHQKPKPTKPQKGALIINVLDASNLKGIPEADIEVKIDKNQRTGITDENGKAKISRITPGENEVRVRAEEYNEVTTNVSINSGATTQIEVRLKKEIPGNLAVYVKEVKNDKLLGLMDVEVKLKGPQTKTGNTKWTDKDGFVMFNSAPLGQYHVTASKNKYWSETVETKVTKPNETVTVNITLKKTKKVPVQMIQKIDKIYSRIMGKGMVTTTKIIIYEEYMEIPEDWEKLFVREKSLEHTSRFQGYTQINRYRIWYGTKSMSEKILDEALKWGGLVARFFTGSLEGEAKFIYKSWDEYPRGKGRTLNKYRP